MTWAMIGGAAVSVVGGSLLSGGGSGGSGQGGNAYTPTGLNQADQGWQGAYGAQMANASNAGQIGQNAYLNSYNQQSGINYAPYQQSQNLAGQQYGQAANVAGQQVNQYGQQASQAGGQQQALYAAGNAVNQTAQDPQNALFAQQQQLVTDQTRAGQAARGLGNSPEGAMEENQSLQNFDINWQNQQLARQAQGVTSMAQASQAGGAQGQLVGANMSGQQQAAAAMPGYTQQSGQVPMQGQQYVAAQPAAAAQAYGTGMQNMNSLYGNVAGQAIQYMNEGIGAQQYQQNQTTAQNNLNANLMGNVGTAAINSANTPGSWLNNATFGGGNNQGFGTGSAYGNQDYGAYL